MSLANDIRTRLYLNGAWRDVSDHVRAESGVSYRRGRGDSDNVTPPSECSLVLDNGATKGNGAYIEQNPLSPWYGYLQRFTPAEVKLRTVVDTATTAAASSWGSTDAHVADGVTTSAWDVLAWTNTGGVAGDYNKASGKATHLIQAANSNRFSHLADFSARDLDMAITMSLAITNITGGVIGSDFLLRAQSLGEYYAMRVLIQTDESITLDIVDAFGTSLGLGPLVVPGLTHSSAQALRMRMQCEGQTVRAKIWAASGDEPFAWHKTFTDEGLTATTLNLRDAAGFVGIRSIVGSGNTNVPVTISFDDLEISTMLATGEVSSWPQSRDVTGGDQTTRIVIGGPKRRLTVAKTLSRSALYSQIKINALGGYLPTPQAYFPMEDGAQTATDKILEASGGSATMRFVASSVSSEVSKVEWGADSSRPGSKQSATLTGGGHLVVELSPPVNAGWFGATWQVKFNYSDGHVTVLGTTAAPDAPIYFTFDIAPETTQLEMRIDGGGLTVPGAMVHDFGTKEDVEQWHTIQLEVFQDGADVAFFLFVDGEFTDGYTEFGFTMRPLQTVQLSSMVDAGGDTIFGHLAVYAADIANVDTAEVHHAGQGNPGELPVFRAKRIAQEYGYEFDWIGYGGVTGTPDLALGDPAVGDGRPLGAQRVGNVIDLLGDAEKVDHGLLYEQRSTSAIQFRTYRSMYSRSSWVTLDMSAGQLSPPLVPVPDDQGLTNRFTARRTDGGEYVHALDSGPMSTLPPDQGGIGLMERGDNFNVQDETHLPDIASLHVARGTIRQERYPSVKVELHRPDVYGTAGMLAKLRDLDIGDQVTLTGMARNRVYDDRDVLVVGLNGRVDQLTHTLTLVTSHAELLRVWTPGATTATATEFARADSEYTTIDEDLTSSETDVTIEVEATRAFWVNSTDHPDAFPFNVICGGEVMTVTAGTAPAGQNQTWTVTRNINNLPGGKTHSAGAKISLHRPNYMGL